MSPERVKFRLQLLGSFGLFDADGRRIEISSRKGMALVALLATAQDGVRTRTWLRDMLWGSRGDAQADASLRSLLRALRQTLNCHGSPILLDGPGRIELALDLVAVDVREPGLNLEGRTFLEGIDIRGEEGFEDWLRDQRAAISNLEAIQPSQTQINVSSAADLTFRPQKRVQKARPTIAVLRFEATTGIQEDTYLAEGIAEEILSGLARSRLLSVASRHSSLTIDPAGITARKICAQMEVEYIVQGQVRRRPGGLVRVSVFLVNGVSDQALWSRHFDIPFDDVLNMQDEIVISILGALEPALLGHEETLSLRVGSRSTRHWDLFMRGRWHFWRATLADWAQARTYLVDALALEPDDVPTLSHLALCNLGEVWGGVAKDSGRNIAEAHALGVKAVANDPTDAYAHYVLGTVLSLTDQLDQAEAEQRRALELNPYLAASLGELGRLHVFAGRWEEAIACAARAIAISPNDPHLFLWFRTKALAHLMTQRFPEAVKEAVEACARSPHQFFLHYLLAACYAKAGDYKKASIALKEGQRLQPHYTREMVRRAYSFANPEHLETLIFALEGAGWRSSDPPPP